MTAFWEIALDSQIARAQERQCRDFLILMAEIQYRTAQYYAHECGTLRESVLQQYELKYVELKYRPKYPCQ